MMARKIQLALDTLIIIPEKLNGLDHQKRFLTERNKSFKTVHTMFERITLRNEAGTVEDRINFIDRKKSKSFFKGYDQQSPGFSRPGFFEKKLSYKLG